MTTALLTPEDEPGPDRTVTGYLLGHSSAPPAGATAKGQLTPDPGDQFPAQPDMGPQPETPIFNELLTTIGDPTQPQQDESPGEQPTAEQPTAEPEPAQPEPDAGRPDGEPEAEPEQPNTEQPDEPDTERPGDGQPGDEQPGDGQPGDDAPQD